MKFDSLVGVQIFHYLHQRTNHVSSCMVFHPTLLAEKMGKESGAFQTACGRNPFSKVLNFITGQWEILSWLPWSLFNLQSIALQASFLGEKSSGKMLPDKLRPSYSPLLNFRTVALSTWYAMTAWCFFSSWRENSDNPSPLTHNTRYFC